MTQNGGNEDIYKKSNKRYDFALSLKNQHPDIVNIVWRFNRWHHQVNYKPFKKNKLIYKNDIIIKDGINNYGMKLKTIK